MRFIFLAIFALFLTVGYSQSDCLVVIPTRGTDSVVVNTNQILYAVQAPSSSTANIVISDFSNIQTRITLDSLIALLPDLIKFTDSQNSYPTAINKQQIREIKRSSTNKAVLFVNWNKQLRYTSTQSYSAIRALADACAAASASADVVYFDNTGTPYNSSNVQDALEEVSQTTYGKSVFVSSTSASGGMKYYINKPMNNLWAAKDSLLSGENLFVYPGTYTYTGPYSSNPITGGFSLAKTDSTDFWINGSATIAATGGSSTFYPLFSDVTANFATSTPRRFKIYGPNSIVSAQRGSQTICVPFGFYDLNSELTVSLDKIISTNGRSWGFQVGAKRVFASVNEVNISGNIGFGIWRVTTSSGEYTGVATRNIQASIGAITASSIGDLGGVIRVQTSSSNANPAVIDDKSFFKINVGKITLNTNPSTVITVLTSNFRNGVISISVDEIEDLTSGNSGRPIVTLASRSDPALDTILLSNINIAVGKAVTVNSALSTGQELAFAGKGLVLDSSVVNVNFDYLRLTNAASKFDMQGITMLRGSVYNINCSNCFKNSSSSNRFFEFIGGSYSPTSKIVVSGSYRQAGANPVISLTAATPLYLRDCYLYNDGGVLINATVPVTVFIDGPTNVTSANVNSNVTLVYTVAPKVFQGTGSPEGVVTAPIGSIYTRTDGGVGTTLYVKESGTGNTGWVAK